MHWNIIIYFIIRFEQIISVLCFHQDIIDVDVQMNTVFRMNILQTHKKFLCKIWNLLQGQRLFLLKNQPQWFRCGFEQNCFFCIFRFRYRSMLWQLLRTIDIFEVVLNIVAVSEFIFAIVWFIFENFFANIFEGAKFLHHCLSNQIDISCVRFPHP